MAWASPFFLSYFKFFVLKSQQLMIGRNACLHTHIHQQLGTDKGIKPRGCHNQLPSDASSLPEDSTNSGRQEIPR